MKNHVKLFSLKAVTAILAVGYSILQVRYFGASREIEIFFAAQSLVYLLTSLTQAGQLSEIFLPEYHKLNNKTDGLGYLALNVVINRMLLFGSILLIAVFMVAPFLVKLMVPGFDANDQNLVTVFFRILIPYLLIQIILSFFINVLNAERQFGRAEALGLVNTTINILFLVLLFPSIGVWCLIIALLVGKLIEFFVYYFQMRQNGYRYKAILSTNEFDHKAFFKEMRSTLVYVCATQILNIVLTASISFLPEGIYAIFKYTQNLTSKIKNLFIQPFITIFFTSYSQLLHASKSVKQILKTNMISLLNINIIVIMGTLLLGDFIIDLIWGGDKFSSNDVHLAYLFLAINSVGILFSSYGALYRKMAVAKGHTAKLYRFWSVSQIISAIFIFLSIKYFAINGLLFYVVFNAFVLSLVSFYIYSQTVDQLSKLMEKRHIFYGIGLIGFAMLLRFNFGVQQDYYGLTTISIIFLIGCIVLVLYPLFTLYRH